MSATAPPRDPTRPSTRAITKYVALVHGDDVIAALGRQLNDTRDLLRSVTEEAAGSRYQPGKWSVKELVGHIIDGERVFAYRALRFARGDATPLPGFDQDPYVAAANSDARTLASLAEEFEHVRASTLLLLQSLDGEAWLRRGTASDNEVSVRALAYIIAGHEAHHIKILRERYLTKQG